MFKYTKSAVYDTFDLIKRLIHIFQIGIQLIYIMYIIYRLVSNSGNKLGNIILLFISAAYFLFQIITTKAFYTKKQISQKKVVKRIFKTTKYLVNTYIITLAVILLLNSNSANENATMLITVLMILGVLLSILFDIILVLIDNQIILIKSAIIYDIEIFKSQHDFATKAIKKVGIDLDQVPKLSNKKVIKKVEKANYNQEQKKIKKDHFHKNIKKR